MSDAKIILLGPKQVGKSALYAKLLNKAFAPKKDPIIDADQVTLDTKKYWIWDTPGDKGFSALTQLYLAKSHLYCFVYDVSDVNSFKRLNEYIALMRGIDTSRMNCIALIANKLDKEDNQVSLEDHEAKLKELSALFPDALIKGIRTSANDAQLFESMSDFLTKEYPLHLKKAKLVESTSRLKQLVIDSYINSANGYENHLINDIRTELLAHKDKGFKHPIFALIEWDKLDNSINNLIYVESDDLKIKPDQITGPEATLLGALYKAQKLRPVIDELKNPVIQKSNDSRIKDFQISIKEIAKDLTKRRMADNYFKTFLRGLGVFGATLLGLTFFGVGAFVGYYYSKQCLFGEKGVTGTKFVDVIKEKSSSAERAGVAQNQFSR